MCPSRFGCHSTKILMRSISEVFMNETIVRVRRDNPIGTISPRLYGHFAEHLGRCCYDGFWVGASNTRIPHEGGFRKDVLAALKELPVPLLRWPGGCYADH